MFHVRIIQMLKIMDKGGLVIMAEIDKVKKMLIKNKEYLGNDGKVLKGTDQSLKFDKFYGIFKELDLDGNTFRSIDNIFDLYNEKISICLLTKRNERIFNHTFGSGLNDMVFETLNSFVTSQITKEIESVIHSHLPEVTIEDIQIRQTDDDHKTHIILTYSLSMIQQNNIVSITI